MTEAERDWQSYWNDRLELGLITYTEYFEKIEAGPSEACRRYYEGVEETIG